MRRHLGEFEQLLLLAVIRAGDDACGPTLREVVRERTRRVLSPGAIYTGLDRLERRGFVRSRLGEPTPERGGKRKRFYQLHPAGLAALRETQAGLAVMAQGLKAIAARRT
jgi:DNA-binding PadR family transcriptional regulator